MSQLQCRALLHPATDCWTWTHLKLVFSVNGSNPRNLSTAERLRLERASESEWGDGQQISIFVTDHKYIVNGTLSISYPVHVLVFCSLAISIVYSVVYSLFC